MSTDPNDIRTLTFVFEREPTTTMRQRLWTAHVLEMPDVEGFGPSIQVALVEAVSSVNTRLANMPPPWVKLMKGENAGFVFYARLRDFSNPNQQRPADFAAHAIHLHAHVGNALKVRWPSGKESEEILRQRSVFNRDRTEAYGSPVLTMEYGFGCILEGVPVWVPIDSVEVRDIFKRVLEVRG